MRFWNRLLLDIGGIDLPKPNRSLGKLPGLLLSDVLIIVGLALGLLLVLGLGFTFWVKLRRKRRRHVSGGEKVYREGTSSHSEDDAAAGSVHSAQDGEPDHQPEHEGDPAHDHHHHHHHHHHGRRRYKYRVRRRSHRSRNPTLSETGGLPPVKTQDSGKPV